MAATEIELNSPALVLGEQRNNAAISECNAPRCPNGARYGIPSLNEITSASGNNASPDMTIMLGTSEVSLRNH